METGVRRVMVRRVELLAEAGGMGVVHRRSDSNSRVRSTVRVRVRVRARKKRVRFASKVTDFPEDV
jgi:hypothetical protein